MLKRMMSRKGWWITVLEGFLFGILIVNAVQQPSNPWIIGGAALLVVSIVVTALVS
jgi:hypothetical protein